MKFKDKLLTSMFFTGPFTPPMVTVGKVMSDGSKFISSKVNYQIRKTT